VAVALAQIGEFSFMLSRVGTDLELLSAEAGNTIVAVAILSIVLNPLLYRLVRPMDRWTLARPSIRRLVDRSRPETSPAALPPALADPEHRAIVVGYGPTGRLLTRLLKDNGFDLTVIDMNVHAVRELRDQGMRAVLGDATRRETLAEADAANSGTLVLTSAGMADAEETIRWAKELNPKIQVLARSSYLRDVPALQAAGAEKVVSAEAETAMALTEIVLHRLGATRDQIDQARDRVRSELRPA